MTDCPVSDLMDSPEFPGFMEALRAEQDADWLRWEAENLRTGLPTLFEFYCSRCHHRHWVYSAIGRRHERFGNPLAVRAARKDVLRWPTSEASR